jgi:hypothetical protein
MNPPFEVLENAAKVLAINNKIYGEADIQYNYNLAMIAYKQNFFSKIFSKIPFFNNLIKKPEIPENYKNNINLFDVSEWDIEAIKDFTAILQNEMAIQKSNNSKDNDPFFSADLGVNTDFSIHTGGMWELESKLKQLERDKQTLENDSYYDKENEKSIIFRYTQEQYKKDLNNINDEIEKTKKEINLIKEKSNERLIERLKKMSFNEMPGKGGKSRTKQHYRNKSNKRKSKK